jgi:hypothetical protein
MERENYYILLELSIDPPENDLKIIEKAIQAKKVEWSRLRNHPTKGLQIQKFINMIPDMQNVMFDEALRKKEAEEATESIESDKETKISEIDGHIDILMGKGYIAKEDIIRLAEIHGLSQSEINSRIESKKSVKFTRIDQQIGLRMGKGYITEDELVKISKKNAMDLAEVRKRVRCPIIKDEKEAENLSIRPLDKSIEKAINDNLNIIREKSLYDFLGLNENSELKQLQESAGKKKKRLAEVGKKDAVVTAGIALAGHCLTIFKTMKPVLHTMSAWQTQNFQPLNQILILPLSTIKSGMNILMRWSVKPCFSAWTKRRHQATSRPFAKKKNIVLRIGLKINAGFLLPQPYLPSSSSPLLPVFIFFQQSTKKMP